MTHSLLGEPLHPHDPVVQYRRKAQPGDIGYLAQGGGAVCFAECQQVEEQDEPADGSQTKW